MLISSEDQADMGVRALPLTPALSGRVASVLTFPIWKVGPRSPGAEVPVMNLGARAWTGQECERKFG